MCVTRLKRVSLIFLSGAGVESEQSGPEQNRPHHADRNVRVAGLFVLLVQDLSLILVSGCFGLQLSARQILVPHLGGSDRKGGSTGASRHKKNQR